MRRLLICRKFRCDGKRIANPYFQYTDQMLRCHAAGIATVRRLARRDANVYLSRHQ
jgi:hypothetical protein